MSDRSTTAPENLPAGRDRVSDRVASLILDRIARGELMPGQRLPGERQLAEDMGVSRVSVRAALQSLKTQGFLDAVQGGRTRVVSSARDMDPALTEMVRTKAENLYDLAEMRVVLETWAARRAAIQATPEQIAALRRTVALMEAPDRLRQRNQDDVAFHFAIAHAAGSAVYMHILSVIRETLTQLMEFQRQDLFGADEDATIVTQHRAILSAIEARNPDAAAQAMATHLNWVLAHYQRSLSGRTGSHG